MKQLNFFSTSFITNEDDGHVTAISCIPNEIWEKNERTGKHEGYIIDCVALKNNYEKFRIKLLTAKKPPFTDEDLSENPSGIGLLVTGFRGTIYTKNGELAIAATAESAEVQ